MLGRIKTDGAGYKNQPGNAVQGNSRCFFSHDEMYDSTSGHSAVSDFEEELSFEGLTKLPTVIMIALFVCLSCPSFPLITLKVKLHVTSSEDGGSTLIQNFRYLRT